MLHACHLDSVMKFHADLDEFASVHAALFLSEGLHTVYHICIIYSLVFSNLTYDLSKCLYWVL